MLVSVKGTEMNKVLLNTGLQKYFKMSKKGEKFTTTENHSFLEASKEDETPTKDRNGNVGDVMLLDKTRISEDLDAVKKRECLL